MAIAFTSRVLAAPLSLASAVLVMPHEEKSFVGFKRDNGVLYTSDEYHLRLGIFLANARFVQEFNAGGRASSLV